MLRRRLLLAAFVVCCALTPSTIYRIGSLTKQFTAAAVMRLVKAGKMSLDDPLEKYLPDFPVGPAAIASELIKKIGD